VQVKTSSWTNSQVRGGHNLKGMTVCEQVDSAAITLIAASDC
jgi:hypothetical protein